MKYFYRILFFLLVVFPSTTGQAQQLPVYFVPNEGQWQHPFLYKGLSPSANFYLSKTGITYVVGAADNPGKEEAFKLRATLPDSPVTLRYHAYKMSWLGANPDPATQTAYKQSYYLNYYLGKNPKHWKSKVGVYGVVTYKNLYPDINLEIHSEKGLPKYDFIVHPGGNADKIRLQFSGLDDIQIKKGNLVLKTSVGIIKELKPYAYQYINGSRQEVKCRYRLLNNTVQFEFPKDYDHHRNLTIDPSIIFATLTGSTSDNWGFSATYDKTGNLYAAGIVGGPGYPTTLGAFQITWEGGNAGPRIIACDVSISKFNTSGTSLLYSTYLGGIGNEMPHSLIVNDSGDLIVAGKTQSNNFPVTANAYDTSYKGDYDLFLTKFNADGTALLGSTYIGGSGNDGVNVTPYMEVDQSTLKYNYGDNSRSEVNIDRQGNIYLASCTQSSNFPTTTNAFSSSLGGGNQDGVFIKMNSSLTNLIYSTFIGGSDTDAAYVLTLDTSQNYVYVGGGTSSSDFASGTTSGAWQSAYQGGIADGFICRFQNSGNYTLLRTTFVGTNAYDQVYGLKTDFENGVYALGQSLGSFPVSPNVYSNPGSPQFILKLNNTLSTRLLSTVFGSGPSAKPNISPVAFMVDTCQNVYVSGWASAAISPGSSTNGMPITPNAFQSTTDGSDFYFAVFSQNLSGLLFGSFFGAPGKLEHVDGGTSRFDPDGIVYEAICASCGFGSAFPATPGAYATQDGASNCNLGAVKIAFNLGSVNAVAGAVPTSGCIPLTVNFINNSTNATSYLWDFGDGTTSTSPQPSHTYTSPGNYQVMLAAANPVSCKTHDTDYVTIHASDNTIEADFDFTLKDTCSNPYIVIQNNSTTYQGQSQNGATYIWNFGDGTSYTGTTPPNHYYTSPGAYNIRLIMIDSGACNSPDTLIKTLIFDQQWQDAAFALPDTLCQGLPIAFQNNSSNGDSYQWNFGDGNFSDSVNPHHTFPNPGTYQVLLISYNSQACNPVDSMLQTITITSSPTAAFTATPIQPETNTPTTFHNQSQNASRYKWDFGDGHFSEAENPVHQFPQTGTFNVCLTAWNAQGCYDKVCKKVSSFVRPLADIPSGFSPNGDGKNDILYVRGYAIQTMDLKIFNRWGQLVFESQNQNDGWDGKFHGQPQEMDAYAYTLSVTFTDGSRMHKKGNVTLLR